MGNGKVVLGYQYMHGKGHLALLASQEQNTGAGPLWGLRAAAFLFLSLAAGHFPGHLQNTAT